MERSNRLGKRSLSAALLLALTMVLQLLSSAAWARSITIAWDPNPPEESVSGYIVYYGLTSRSNQGFQGYDAFVDVGSLTTATVDLQEPTATYYLAVVSYNEYGLSSDYSEEVSAAIATFSLTASAGPNGSISPSGSLELIQGESQTYTVSPEAGYRVEDVKVDGTSVGPVTSYTFTNVTANHTIHATFTIRTFALTASAGPNGSISPSGLVNVAYGMSETFTLSADAGYHVGDVKVDGTSVGAVTTYTFSNVTSDHTIEATFDVNTFTLTASAGPNGSINPSGSVAVVQGGSQSFVIAPAAGYRVADVQVDGSSVGAVTSYTFADVTAAHTISATFAAGYTISAEAGANGRIRPSGKVTVQAGSRQIFRIFAAAGYQVADVLVDGSSVGAVTSYVFWKVAANHTIFATFTKTGSRVRVASTTAGGGTAAKSGSESTPVSEGDGIGEPLQAVVQAPVSGGTVTSLQPTLSVYNPVVVGGPMTYEFQLARDRAMTELEATATDVVQGVGVTSWSVPLPLADGARYYWRARASGAEAEGPWTEVATFQVDLSGEETTVVVETSGFLLTDRENRFELPAQPSGGKPLEAWIPAGALPYDSIFAAGPVANPPAAQTGLSLIGRVYDLAPGGVRLSAPAILAIPYAEEDLEAANVEDVRDVRAFTYNTETLVWEPVAAAWLDADSGRLFVEVQHFSMYALGVQ